MSQQPEPSPSLIAEAFGLGVPTGPLVTTTSGPSAVHRSWRLSTSRGRFAVKAFSRDNHAHSVEALVAARAAETVPLLVTHCDLVPGNVLVSADGRPWIVDWDDAGPWNPAEEVAAAVVSWSSGAHGEPDQRVALALMDGYRLAGGAFPRPSPTALAGSLSAVANWLELNVRRSLDEGTAQSRRSRAEAEVASALGELAWRLGALDRWMALLG